MNYVHDERNDGRNVPVTLVGLTVLAVSILTPYVGGFDGEFDFFAALLAIPASIGALVTNVSNAERRWPAWKILVVPSAFIIAMTGVAWLIAAEGAICIAMVLPLWIPASIGGAIVRVLEDRRRRRPRNTALHAVGWAVLPAVVMTLEGERPPEWQVRTVSRSVVIDQSPSTIWPTLLSIADVRPNEGRPNLTQDMLGVPRPTQARLTRFGHLLVRRAGWGPSIRFDEVITSLHPQRELSWRFSFPDDSVQRHTDRHVAPDGEMLNIVSGRYSLGAVGRDRTRVTLATTYRMKARFPAYFAWWGELMLGDIQANVLAIIADRHRRRPSPGEST